MMKGKEKSKSKKEDQRNAKCKAPRPKGLGFPARWLFHIVPLDPALKGGACGARSGQNPNSKIKVKVEVKIGFKRIRV
jgi:hypothetical protein